MAAGACGYVLKNALDLDLAAAVKKVAAGEKVLDPAVARPAPLPGERARRLTPRELEVLQLICNGLSNKEIAVQARGERQHRGGAPGQHHERARRAQGRRARGLRAAERPRQPAMNRREFLRRCARGRRSRVAGGRLRPPRQGRLKPAPQDPGSAWPTSPPRPASTFRHNSGAYGGKLLPETLGSGCAFLDYDGDGWPDILFVNSMDWPGPQAAAVHAAPLPQQPQRHVHRRHARRRARRRALRHGRGRRRLRQRRLSRPLRHLRRPEPAVPQHRQGHVRGRHARQRARSPHRRSAPRRCGWTSIATAGWTCSSATTSSGPRPPTCSAA